MKPEQIAIWAPTGISVVAGLAAVSSSGSLRAIMLVVAMLAAMALALVVSRLGRDVEADMVLGGVGYHAALPLGVLLVHAASTILYGFGILVVIFAGFARFELLGAKVATDWVLYMPAGISLFVLILGSVAAWRQLEAGFSRTWYSRVHGIILAVAGGIITAAGLANAFGASFISSNDVLIFAMVGVLGVGTQMMFSTSLPTLFDLVGTISRKLSSGKKGDEVDTPPVVYAGIVAVVVSAVLMFLIIRFNLLSKFGGISDERSVFLIVILPLVLALFFAASAFQLWRESRRGLYKERLSTKLRNDLLVYGLSALFGLMTASLLVRLLIEGSLEIGPWTLGTNGAKDLIMLTIVVTTGPIGIYLHKEYSRVSGIEDRLPDLLNDLAESRRAGLTLPSALRAATRADYGPLSPDVAKMADQVDWGVPFDEAFRQFADRTKTPLVGRSVRLVIEASRTGGSIADILKAAGKDIHDIKTIEHDRQVSMSTYLVVIYVVFMVFMVVLSSLDAKFVPEILDAGAKVDGPTAGVTFSKIDPEELRFVYFNAAMVQALGNGMVAGVLTEGRVTAGFRHAAVMTFIGWVVFRVLLGN